MSFENYHFNYSLTGDVKNPVILFLHGFMGNIYSFSESIRWLSKQFYCLSVDLPGHGKTQVIGGNKYYTMPKTAEALIQLLNKLNIDQCFLIGYSMGGRLALYLTIHFPERFYKVILESSSPGIKTQLQRKQRLKNDLQLAYQLETIEYSKLDLFFKKWYNQSLFDSFRKHPKFNKALKKRLKNNPKELAKSLRNFSTGLQPSLWEKLKSNQILLLLLVGELDQKFIAINREMASYSESITLKIIRSCGHNIHFENANKFIETVEKFLLT